MFYKKIIIGLAIALIGVPTVAMAGSVTVSLIQGKTPAEAVLILAEQLDVLMGRVDQIEGTQVQIQADVDMLEETADQLFEQMQSENVLLREKIVEQEKKRQNNEYCEELSKIGSQYLPTKQHIKELYENLVAQNQSTFEDDYEAHKQNGAKVLSEKEYREQWEGARSGLNETITKLKPHYDEYVNNCTE